MSDIGLYGITALLVGAGLTILALLGGGIVALLAHRRLGAATADPWAFAGPGAAGLVGAILLFLLSVGDLDTKEALDELSPILGLITLATWAGLRIGAAGARSRRRAPLPRGGDASGADISTD